MSDRSIAPTPEVQHLPTLFRRIDTGEIRIPLFQRGFVWREAEVVALFDSVYRGYPIGSLLLWKVDSQIFKQDKGGLIPFPQHEPREYPVSYVLDGMQRLCCLYGAFNYSETMSSLFNVHFEIETEKFFIPDPKVTRSLSIPLASLFSPRRFLDLTKQLAGQATAGDPAISKALDLQLVFQEYLVPTVTIASRSPSQVVEIFKRINSTGVDLSAVDFVRALVWDPEFDLNDELEKMAREIQLHAIQELNPETLTKVLAIALGKEPTSQSMYELHDFAVPRLREGVTIATSALIKALLYLRSQFGIHSTESLPYEGQLLVLCSIYLRDSTAIETSLHYFRVWFLATSLNEELRGKPDHFVARMIREFEQMERDQAWPLPSLSITARDLVQRRLIRGKALTIGILVLFYLKGARDFVTGEVIPPALYLTELNSEFTQSVVALELLRASVSSKLVSSRLAPNVYLVAEPQIGASENPDLFDRVLEGDELAGEIVDTQFFQPHVLEYLRQGEFEEFLLARAKLMLDFAETYIWEF